MTARIFLQRTKKNHFSFFQTMQSAQTDCSDYASQDTVILEDIPNEPIPDVPAHSTNPISRITERYKGNPTTGQTLRKFILLTLSHVEQRGDMDRDTVAARLHKHFICQRVIIAREVHDEGGYHYHCAIQNSSASKNTATKYLRKIFPEFTGAQINVKFHKSWFTMLRYVTKEDKLWDQFVYSDTYTPAQAKEELQAIENKTLRAVYSVRDHIEKGKSVAELAYNDAVAPYLFRSCNSVTKFAEYCKQARHNESTLEAFERLAAAGNKSRADAALTNAQKDALIDFIWQLHGRKPRDPQLYLVGPSCSGKSYPFTLLSQHMDSCFIPCLENNERAFSGYCDGIHDWIFINDFHDNIRFQLLSNLCEGAPMTLNGYGCQNKKRNNVPLVFTANRLPIYGNLQEVRRQALINRLDVHEFNTIIDEGQTPLEIQDLAAYCHHVALVVKAQKEQQ
jgi:hypothetical protein